jgi:hypothetical protein
MGLLKTWQNIFLSSLEFLDFQDSFDLDCFGIFWAWYRFKQCLQYLKNQAELEL